MFAYPVDLTADGRFLMVTFPDIPEANSQGEDVEEALRMAKDALETALDFYFDSGRPVPLPSKPRRGQHIVELAPSVAAKVLLLNEMATQKVRPAELARRMNLTPQEVSRLTNLRYGSKIDGIAAALKALNKTMEIRLI